MLPRVSRTRTVDVEVDAPSFTIASGENEQVRWSAGPAVNTIVAVVLFKPVAENVTTHPEYAPLLVNVNVARPCDVAPDEATTTLPPPAPVHVPESRLAVMGLVALVTRRPLTSWTSTVTVVRLCGPAACGESLLETASLFAAPTICVVSVAELPAMLVLLVVAVKLQVPGVEVAWTVKSVRPLAAVAVALPSAMPPTWVPVATAVTLQMFAEAASRVTVICVVWSLITRLPFAS